MNKQFWSGVALLAVSYGQLLLKQSQFGVVSLTLFWTAFMLGIIYVSRGISVQLGAPTLLPLGWTKRRTLATFAVASTVSGIALDGTAQLLNKLWVYPYFTNGLYALVFIPGYVGYFLMIGESYMATKAVVDRLARSKPVAARRFAFEPNLYKVLGVLGVGMVIAAVLLTLRAYQPLGGYVFNIATTVDYHVSFGLVVLLFGGIWFVCEYISSHRGKTSFLQVLLRGYSVPLIAMVVGAIVLAFIMETENIRGGYWRYTNWPLANIKVLGMPALMMFVAWPLHYLMFLSIFQALTPKSFTDVWAGARGTKK